MGMFHLGPTELIILLVLVLLVFGPRRLPELSRSIGKTVRDVRRAVKGADATDVAQTDQPNVPGK